MSPVVFDAVEKYDQNIRRLKAGDSRNLQAKESKLECGGTKVIRRENLKIDRFDSTYYIS